MASQQQMMQIAQAAMKGDEDAAAQIIAQAFPLVRERYEGISNEIQRREESEWNREATRKQVLDDMDGTVPKEMTTGALSDIHEDLLQILALTPAALLAQNDEEAKVIGEMWTESVLQLTIKMHNPTIRYAIVGGFDPDRQEEVDEYFDRMGTELWGAVDVLSQSGNLNADDFPPETRAVLNETIERIENSQQAGD